MARRRMFSLELISSDKFLGMRPSAQSFYFHMGMHADDEGFVSAPHSLGLLCRGTEEDLQELERKGYVIRFASGVLVIVDWMIHNTIRKDRSVETLHRTEKGMLELVEGRYTLKEEVMSAKMATGKDDNFFDGSAAQNRTEENRTEHNRIDKNSPEHSSTAADFPAAAGADLADWMDQEREDPPKIDRRPTFADICKYCEEQQLSHVYVTDLWSFFTSNDWKDRNGQVIHDWKAMARAWNRREMACSNSS